MFKWIRKLLHRDTSKLRDQACRENLHYEIAATVKSSSQVQNTARKTDRVARKRPDGIQPA